MEGEARARDGRPATRWRIVMWSAMAVLLLAPAVAMRFTREVQWTAFDFAVFGGLLALAGGACELAARRATGAAYRAAVGLAVLTAFLLVWATGAVGVFGDEGDPANLMFAGVLAVGVAGALAARFRPTGMAWAMAATAGAQMLAVSIALMADRASLYEAALASGFAAPWLVSAYLFGRSA